MLRAFFRYGPFCGARPGAPGRLKAELENSSAVSLRAARYTTRPFHRAVTSYVVVSARYGKPSDQMAAVYFSHRAVSSSAENALR